MKILRYRAKTVRDAMRRVREEQGADAVILSNRRVEDGVEIVTAVDFDELGIRGDAGRSARAAEQGIVRPTAPPPAPPAPAPKPPADAAARTAVRAQPAPPRRSPAPPPLSTATPVSTPPMHRPGGKPSKPVPRPLAGAAEPAMLEMRDELNSLRDMLEQQLSDLVWGDIARRSPVQARLLRELVTMELGPGLARDIVASVDQDCSHDRAWRHALVELTRRLRTTDDDILGRGGVVALLGPTGVGKTTTVAKLAARFCVRNGARSVALVSTDTYRIGGHEYLRSFATMLGVPLRCVSAATELAQTLQDLPERKLVLVDTAGVGYRDTRLPDQLALVRTPQRPVRNYLVISATTRVNDLDTIIRAYRQVDLTGCIVTKLDEAGSIGGLIDVLITHGLPVAYMSYGQRVPEDLCPARAHNLISRCVAMSRRQPMQPRGAAGPVRPKVAAHG
jgi:flagellar biosynthesis protein FlhF